MATVLPTTLDTIYLNLQARLISFLGWNQNQVLIMDPEALPANKHPANPPVYVLLWPAPEQANVGIFRGASRLDTRLTERLVVTLRTATALDDYKERPIWLTDPNIGHLRYRSMLWDALVGYCPEDDEENMLTIGPLEPAESRAPRMADEKHYRGQSAIGLQFIYLPLLSPPLA